jgi:hypothetical protein
VKSKQHGVNLGRWDARHERADHVRHVDQAEAGIVFSAQSFVNLFEDVGRGRVVLFRRMVLLEGLGLPRSRPCLNEPRAKERGAVLVALLLHELVKSAFFFLGEAEADDHG